MENDEIKLPSKPPFVFPEPRVLAGVAGYNNKIPYAGLLSSAKCIFGAVYGVDDDGAAWLEKQLSDNPAIQCRIILMVYPACPTRETTLMKLLELQNTMGDRIRLAIHPVRFFAGHPVNALLIACTSERYFAMGLMVDQHELRTAMNVLDDAIYKENNVYYRARIETEKVHEIVEGEMNNQDKCQALLDIIHGKSWEQKVSE